MAEFPFSFNLNILPSNEIKYNDAIKVYNSSLSTLKHSYDDIISSALNALQHPKDETYQHVINIINLLGEKTFNNPSGINTSSIKPVYTHIINTMNERDRSYVVQLYKDTDLIWSTISPKIKDNLNGIIEWLNKNGNRILNIENNSNVADDVVITLSSIISTLIVFINHVYRTRSQATYKEKYDMLFKSEVLNALFVLILYINSVIKIKHIFTQPWLICQMCFDILEQIIQLNLILHAARNEVVIKPTLMETIHNYISEKFTSTDIAEKTDYTLQNVILRWLNDLKLPTYITVRQNVEQNINTKMDLDFHDQRYSSRAKHFANDILHHYMFIIRNTLFYKYKNNQQILNIAKNAKIINDLCFYNLNELIGNDAKQNIKRIYEGTSVATDPCILLTALGVDTYNNLLIKAYTDSNSQNIQIRLETFLEIMSNDAFNNLDEITNSQMPYTDKYRAIMIVLNKIAQKIHDIMPSISTLFTTLNSENAKENNIVARSKNIISFIKIRNDTSKPNERFIINTNKGFTTLLLNYKINAAIVQGGGINIVADYDLQTAQTNTLNLRRMLVNAIASGNIHDYKTKANIDDHIARYKLNRAKYKRAIDDLTDRINTFNGLTKKQTPIVNIKPNNKKQEIKKSQPKIPEIILPPAPTPLSINQNVIKSSARLINVYPNKPTKLDNKKYGNIDSNTKEQTYLFGPFTKIYKPTQRPVDMVNSGEMKLHVIDQLLAGKDVCMFGYGQSGTGKTSQLIFRKSSPTTGEAGVMHYICNALGDKYSEIECNIREIGIQKSNNVEIIDGEQNLYYAPTTFKFIDGNWTLTADISIRPDLVMSDGAIVDPDLLNTLGGYVFFSTENNRLTKATTNNPTSSRTHVFVFLKFKNGPQFIIGDFAGVENSFACTDMSVLKTFAEIKKFPDNPNLTDRPYDELMNSRFKTDIIPHLTDMTEPLKYSDILDMELATTGFEVQRNAYILAICSQSTNELASGKNIGDTTIIKYITSIQGVITDLVNIPAHIQLIKELNTIKNSYSGPVTDAVDRLQQVINNVNDQRLYRIITWYIFGKEQDYIPLRTGFADYKKVGQLIENIKAIFETNELANLRLALIQATGQLFMSEECNQRVHEGKYINKSLETFQNFLSRNLQLRGETPQAIDQCMAIQCNPFFRDCFGSTFSSPDTITEVEKTLVKMINPNMYEKLEQENIMSKKYVIAQEALKNIVWCIFTVVNISSNKNNPPNTTYIDCNQLLYEYNRAMSLSTRLEYKSSSKTGEPFKVLGDPFNEDVLLEIAERARQFAIVAKMQRGDQQELKQAIIGTSEAYDIINESVTMALNKKHNIDEFLPLVKNVIMTVERVNASTLIGTISFTDTLSKFGLNRTMCTLSNTENPLNYLNTILFDNITKLSNSVRSLNNEPIEGRAVETVGNQKY